MDLVTDGKAANLPDVIQFIKILNALPGHSLAPVRTLFDPTIPLILGRAPGRLDVMGGIADYSGSLVLQLPLQEAVLVALQLCPERTLTIISPGSDRTANSAVFSMPLADFEAGGQPISYNLAQRYFQQWPNLAWAAYIAGVFLVLMREKQLQFQQGARLFIHSNVPEGKGVSSSAAVEVATMAAVMAAFNLSLEPREMALLCQKGENLVVGAPCGVMDQMTAVCGQENQLLALLCQPAELQNQVAIPAELAVWGIDSGIRHAVSGSDYSSVRVGAFMGYRILMDLAGIHPTHNQLSWAGYLANLSPAEFEQRYARHLPEGMAGADFLARYGSTTDPITQVEPDRFYAVRQPTTHPIYEHFRVRTFARLLAGDALTNAPLLGELMYQSHASYSGCGLGSDGTDALVDLVRAAGPSQGLYGAKITGGGSGGTVAILGRSDTADVVSMIAAQYARQAGRAPYLFSGSSPGTVAGGPGVCSHKPNQDNLTI